MSLTEEAFRLKQLNKQAFKPWELFVLLQNILDSLVIALLINKSGTPLTLESEL